MHSYEYTQNVNVSSQPPPFCTSNKRTRSVAAVGRMRREVLRQNESFEKQWQRVPVRHTVYGRNGSSFRYSSMYSVPLLYQTMLLCRSRPDSNKMPSRD